MIGWCPRQYAAEGMQRAPTSGGQAGLATAVEPASADRLNHVGKLLAEKKPWPAFLHITARATEEWEACPTPVQEALAWMTTATVGLLDTASVGPLLPVCQAFKTLIEAAEGAEESEDKLMSLISRCAFLTTVLIQHARAIGPLAQVKKPMDDFVATTNKLAAWAKGGKRRAYSCHHADLSALIDYEEGLRNISNDIASVDGLEHHQLPLAMLRRLCPPALPDMAAVPRGAISLTEAHVARPSLLGRAIGYLTNTALGDAPCDQIHEWLERLVLRVVSTSGTAPPVLGSGKYAEAGPLYARSQAILEKVLGPEHPDVAKPLNDRVELLEKQGKYAEAEPLYARIQAICEKALGSDDPIVANVLSNRAGLLKLQAKYAEADTLYERAAEIWEQALGSDHPTVAIVLHDRAEVLRMQDNFVAAESLYERAQAIQENVLGPEHADVASTLNDRAGVWKSLGKYAEAEPLYERATEIWEKALGPGHPTVGTVLRNRASLLTTQGKYTEAHPLFERALAIGEGALGPDHQDIIACRVSMAVLYTRQGLFDKASPLFEEAACSLERTLGPDHPDFARALNNRASSLRLQ
ncbi:unnamed protein product, partial [Ectocarpus sp. 12 AP-2014]